MSKSLLPGVPAGALLIGLAGSADAAHGPVEFDPIPGSQDS